MSADVDKFFMTYSRDYAQTIVPYINENNIPIMTSAEARWSWRTGKFKSMHSYDTTRVVDSGGFSVLGKNGGYPWSVEEYHEWLEEHADMFEWAACMDLACEERFDDIMSKEERMRRTIENTIKHDRMEKSYEILPVLQGRTVEDYVWSYEQLVEAGVDVSRVGLGTVCRLSSSFEVARIEKEIRKRCPKIEKIHGFGVKFTAFSCGASFDSADSYAWSSACTYGKMYVWEESKITARMTPEGFPNKALFFGSFVNYYKYVSELHERSKPGTAPIRFKHKPRAVEKKIEELGYPSRKG